MASPTLLMSGEQIQSALEQVAQKISEQLIPTEEIILVGILQRGDVLARRLAVLLQPLVSQPVSVGWVDITFHRDDSDSGAAIKTQRETTHLPQRIAGQRVILVDDVIFTGRTIRAALEELNDYGRPAMIQLAVLIDRGHRELPLQPDFVGRKLTTARTDQVIVNLAEDPAQEKIVVQQVATA